MTKRFPEPLFLPDLLSLVSSGMGGCWLKEVSMGRSGGDGPPVLVAEAAAREAPKAASPAVGPEEGETGGVFPDAALTDWRSVRVKLLKLPPSETDSPPAGADGNTATKDLRAGGEPNDCCA